jgi:hypothetical protein
MLFSIFSPITRPTLTSAWAVWQRHGTLLERAPTGGSTSARNSVLLFQRQAWARTQAAVSFARPQRGGARWLSARDGFPPLCPDLLVELASPPQPGVPLAHNGWRRARSFRA